MIKKSVGRWVWVAAIVAVTFAGAAAIQVMGQEGPGPEHKRLDALAGEWDTLIKLWLNGPDREATQYVGTSTRTWTLDRRFLEEKATNPTGFDEGDYETLGYLGFDPSVGVYENLWMNNQSTGMYTEQGRYNPADNTIHTSGSYIDPSTGYMVFNRTEISITGPDSHTLRGYTTLADGREFKQIDITYTRK